MNQKHLIKLAEQQKMVISELILTLFMFNILTHDILNQTVATFCQKQTTFFGIIIMKDKIDHNNYSRYHLKEVNDNSKP